MNLAERIMEAEKSQPVTVKNFDECRDIRPMDVYSKGQKVGRGQVAQLPYGAGPIIKFEGKVMFADSHRPYAGDSGVNIEHRSRFRQVNLPLTIEYMD